MRKLNKLNLLKTMYDLFMGLSKYLKKRNRKYLSVITIIVIVIATFNPSFINTGFAETIIVPKSPDAPHTITAYPQSDNVIIEGYTEANIRLTVKVIHATRGGGIVTSVEEAIPYDDPATPENEGLVEVNHPGIAGICWQGITADIIPGDLVQVIVEDVNNNVLWIDQTLVQNIKTEMAEQLNENTIVVHGSAQGADGNPIPIERLEHRLINGDGFSINGKNTLRAPGDDGEGTLKYDAEGSIHWTATYTGLDPVDITKALEADSVAIWLGGVDPGAASELTIYEVGEDITGGPQPPCMEPLEILPPPPGSERVLPVPEGLTVNVTNYNNVTLNWTPSTDSSVTGYSVYREGQLIANINKPDETTPVATTYEDVNVPKDAQTYQVLARDEVGNRSVLSAVVTAVTTRRPAADITVNNPPSAGLEITPFPSRDFISATGYLESDLVTVEVIRNGYIISTASNITPQDDSETAVFDGLVEVNHPGAACWEGVTPDLRTGDIVRLTAKNADGTTRTVDQTKVANVVGEIAVKVQDSEIDPVTGDKNTGIVEIHGSAMGADGKPIPPSQLEQRLVNGKDRFDYNDGRRTLRASGGDEVLDGILTYDPIDPVTNPLGLNWTTRYEGLNNEDVRRALEAESLMYWLGSDPAGATELTIYEIGLEDTPGPAIGACSAPLEPADVKAPSKPVVSGKIMAGTKDTVQLTWEPSTDDWYVNGYEILKNDQVIARVGANKTEFTDHDVLPGKQKYQVRAFDSASPRELTVTTIIEQIYRGLGKEFGNFSELGTVEVTVTGTIPPSKPKDLLAKILESTSEPSSKNVELTWSPSIDDKGINEYTIYRNGIEIGRTVERSFQDTVPSTSGIQYEYKVQAVDIEGNSSEESDSVNIKMTEFDSVAPEKSDLQLNIPDIHGKDIALKWTESSDDNGISTYQIFRGTERIAVVNHLTTTFVDKDVPAGTYNYTVRAADSYGNLSEPSNEEVGVIANDPPELPRRITVYPSRDAVEATGYAKDIPVTVSVLRKDLATGEYKLISSTSEIMPIDEDPDTARFESIVEVNIQPAGTQPLNGWNTVTPDIRPFDIVRVTQDGIPDQVTVSYIKAGMPIQTAPDTVMIRGVAMNEDGTPIPVDQIDTEGGTTVYDQEGSVKWTSTFNGLTPQEVTALMQQEVNVTWLGRDGINSLGNERTIFENNPEISGGPAGGTSPAPIEENVAIVNTLTPIGFADQQAATESAVQTFTLANSGKINMTIDSIYLAGKDTQDFTFNADDCSVVAPGESCTISVTFKPISIGNKSAVISILTNAYNTPYVTAALNGKGITSSAPDQPSIPTQQLNENTQIKQGSNGKWQIPVVIKWNASSNGTVTTYKLQQSTDNGTFMDIEVGEETSKTLLLELGTLSQEKKYQFRVTACNEENCSAWTTGEQFAVVGIDNKNTSSFSFRDKWTEQTLSGAFGNTVHYVAESGARVDLRKLDFSSTGSIAFVTTKGSNRGSVSFSVDGSKRSTALSLNAPTLQMGQVVYVANNLEPGREHDIQVYSNNNNRVDFDMFVLIK